ncbi:hypothetical protein [Nocardia sp. SC052]
MDLFAGIPRGPNQWDGHSTAEKYERLDEATRLLSEQRPDITQQRSS